MINSQPNKSLGQHWLFDDNSLNAMVTSAKLSRNDVVLEIGPGLGTLTSYLVKTAKQVIAVEYDEELANDLKNQVNADNLEVKYADILDFDFTVMPKGFKVVANIPYYITSHLIRKLCESQRKFSVAVLLVQKEVAERVCADAGQTSLLSISTQYYCEVSMGAIVPAKLFTPPPKVDSQILVLIRRSEPLFKDLDEQKFFKLVKAGFSERRKKLRSSLAGGLHMPKADVDAMLKNAGISPDLRAQALTIHQWHDIYLEIYKN